MKSQETILILGGSGLLGHHCYERLKMDYAIVFLPLLGSLLSGFFGKILGDKLSQIITSLFVSLSSILSILE